LKLFHKLSLITLIAACSFISIYRINNVREKEIAWDVLGYYLYLPATFIHHDPLLNDISWLKQINAEKKLAGTLYMVSQNKKGETLYFFLMGMSLFYLPFFFAGHIFSAFQGYVTDGFSLPYQYSLVIGAIITTIIGLIFLRKIVLHFFSEKTSAIIILIIVFGTNYIQHLTLDNLSTVNVIFTLNTIIIWNTIKWHENFKRKHLITIGICIALAAMVKPTEVFIILIPLLWHVTSQADWKQKIELLFEHKKTILLSCTSADALLANKNRDAHLR
jgi:hypothetical protein